MSRDGTFCNCNAVNNCSPWPYGTRKSSSPCMTSVGVRNSLANKLGDQRAYISGLSQGMPPNSQIGNHNSSVSPDSLRRSKTPACEIRADRKSTRLNSSHGYISYAVFCLKKKKKKNSQQ